LTAIGTLLNLPAKQKVFPIIEQHVQNATDIYHPLRIYPVLTSLFFNSPSILQKNILDLFFKQLNDENIKALASGSSHYNTINDALKAIAPYCTQDEVNGIVEKVLLIEIKYPRVAIYGRRAFVFETVCNALIAMAPQCVNTTQSQIMMALEPYLQESDPSRKTAAQQAHASIHALIAGNNQARRTTCP
jgi:hypothetical protein